MGGEEGGVGGEDEIPVLGWEEGRKRGGRGRRKGGKEEGERFYVFGVVVRVGLSVCF